MSNVPQNERNGVTRGVFFLVLLTSFLFSTGCGSVYWQNRLDDALDVVSFSVGGGLDAQVSISCLILPPLPARSYLPLVGLHGGEFFLSRNGEELKTAYTCCSGVEFLFMSRELCYHSPRSTLRGKSYEKQSVLCCSKFSSIADCETERGCHVFQDSPLSVFQKHFPDGSIEECPESYPWFLFTEIRVQGACFLGASVTFNPGEMLDFLCGFAGCDLFGDDLPECRAVRVDSPKKTGGDPPEQKEDSR